MKAKTSPKDEALRALEHIHKELIGLGTSQTGLNQRLLLATLEYAVEQVSLIQELKRPRKLAP